MGFYVSWEAGPKKAGFFMHQRNEKPVDNSACLEHFSIRLGVSRVCEISFAFFFRNLFEKRGDCSPELLNSARLHFA